jgi:hypothetical protein
MSTPWAQSCVLTSTSQFSNPIALDPLSKMTSVQLTVSSSGGLSGLAPVGAVATFSVQASLDTPAWATNIATPQPSSPSWGVVGSSAYTIVSSGATFTNLSAVDGSATFVLLQPIGGLRLASTGAGSSIATVITLKALQSPTA